MKRTQFTRFFLLIPIFLTCGTWSYSQPGAPLIHIPASVDFSDVMQEWDGFGFNYVETAQTRDYEAAPQDYGGFSLLSEGSKQEILELVFGDEGLQVDLVKMFLDPWHQSEPGGPFNHEWTTRNMLEFVEGGNRIAKAAGRELPVITTLYGPPLWATQQGFIGARDLDESRFPALADYMIHWARFLREREIDVRYLSIHNEGEDFYRWKYEDATQRYHHFDYNAYWSPEQVNRFVVLLSKRIQDSGLENLGATNGEPSNWTRFRNWGYTSAMAQDPELLDHLALLTTHGFINGDASRLSYGTVDAITTSMLREKKPDLRTWVTSFSWGKMGTDFIRMCNEHIYIAGVNALIPWAGIQHPSSWYDGDPNPGTAIRVNDDGSYALTTGYHIYRQLTQAGKRGMRVARAWVANPVCTLTAFASNGTGHPDAFVLADDIFVWGLPFEIRITGTPYQRFKAYRTNVDGSENFDPIGEFEVVDGVIHYDPPRGTVTTFVGVE